MASRPLLRKRPTKNPALFGEAIVDITLALGRHPALFMVARSNSVILKTRFRGLAKPQRNYQRKKSSHANKLIMLVSGV